MDKSKSQKDPLEAEAKKREEWRGGETSLGRYDAPGHTLPESERDGAADAGSDARGAVSGTILPPD